MADLLKIPFRRLRFDNAFSPIVLEPIDGYEKPRASNNWDTSGERWAKRVKAENDAKIASLTGRSFYVILVSPQGGAVLAAALHRGASDQPGRGPTEGLAGELQQRLVPCPGLVARGWPQSHPPAPGGGDGMTAENKDKAIALATTLGLKWAATTFTARDGSERWNVWLFARVDPSLNEIDWSGGVPKPFTSYATFRRYALRFAREFVAA